MAVLDSAGQLATLSPHISVSATTDYRDVPAMITTLVLIVVAGLPALTPSELNASSAKYDGKRVRVRGWLVIQFEQYHFWDSKAASESPTSGANTCVSYLGPIHRTTGKMVILEGTFWKDFAKSLNVIDLGTCNISGLDVDNQPPAD